MKNYLRLLNLIYHKRLFLLNVQLFICVLIIAILMTITMRQYTDYMHKTAIMADFSSMISGLKTDTLIEYGLSGSWPESSTPAQTNSNHAYQLDKISTRQGSFSAQYSYLPTQEKQYLNLRLASSSKLEPTLHWLCGYKEPRSDETATITNTTSIPASKLSQHCQRSSR